MTESERQERDEARSAGDFANQIANTNIKDDQKSEEELIAELVKRDYENFTEESKTSFRDGAEAMCEAKNKEIARLKNALPPYGDLSVHRVKIEHLEFDLTTSRLLARRLAECLMNCMLGKLVTVDSPEFQILKELKLTDQYNDFLWHNLDTIAPKPNS